MSITEITAINENFPIAGIDQPSQGYRDNFANIKTSLTDLDLQVINVIGDISDVDTTTTAPVTGDTLSFDGANWIPGAFSINADSSPQLGGMLDINGFTIGDGSNAILEFAEAVTPVNWMTISNADTANSPTISVVGADIDVDLILSTKNAGSVILGSGDVDVTLSTIANLPLNIKPRGAATLTCASNGIGAGYSVNIRGGSSVGANGDGGTVSIRPGLLNGTGAKGEVIISDDTNNLVAIFKGTASGTPANSFIFVNSITGAAPTMEARGSDTDVGISMIPKGTGKFIASGISYPNADGTTNGDVMKTDAAGTLTFSSPSDLGEFTVATLPDPTLNANSWALATDASGGRTMVRSNGVAWKIVAVEGATVA